MEANSIARWSKPAAEWKQVLGNASAVQSWWFMARSSEGLVAYNGWLARAGVLGGLLAFTGLAVLIAVDSLRRFRQLRLD
jgi:hypothetical protein